jgi:hypothetical protein
MFKRVVLPAEQSGNKDKGKTEMPIRLSPSFRKDSRRALLAGMTVDLCRLVQDYLLLLYRKHMNRLDYEPHRIPLSQAEIL